jgi:hypothetical protein
MVMNHQIPAQRSVDAEDTGYVIGLATKQVPFLDSFDEIVDEHLPLFGLTQAHLRKERYVICFVAALECIRSSLPDPEVRSLVEQGVYAFVEQLEDDDLAKYISTELALAFDFYKQANSDDQRNGWGQKFVPGNMSELELAFGERMLRDIPDDGSKEQATGYVALCMTTPRAIWDMQYQMATRILSDAGLLSPSS